MGVVANIGRVLIDEAGAFVLGKVEASPTANTVLGRLKDASDLLASIKGTDGIKKIVDAVVLGAGSATIGKVDQGTGGASAWKVDGSAVTQPVSGTVGVSNFPAVQPVSDNGGSLTVDSPQLPAALVGGRLDVAVGAPLPAGTNNIGDVDVVSSALPTGAATEATLATRLAEATFTGRVGEVQATPTANTVLGRLKDVWDRLAALPQLPATLTGSGSLKAAIVEAIAAGTNVIGKTIPSDAGGDVLPVDHGVAIPANTPALLWAGRDQSGNARRAEMVYDSEESIYRLAISGKVAVQIPPPPAGGTVVTIAQNDANLDVATTHDTVYTITSGKTLVIQQVIVGAEGDPNEKGSKVEIIYFNGTEHLVDRVYISGTSLFGNYPDTSEARDGTIMVGGTGPTKTLIIRRTRLGGAALEIDSVVRGYEI